MAIVAVDREGRLQLPRELVADWPPDRAIEAVRTEEGVLLRPLARKTWDEVFAHKVRPGTAEPRDLSEELTGDDLLF